MSSPVRTIAPDETMAMPAGTMSRWGHGGLPVVEGGKLHGIVTRKDVDKAMRHGLQHAPVKGFSASEVITVSPDIDIAELERLLATRGIGRVPVMAGSEMVGIVTRKDVLRAEHGASYLDSHLPPLHPKATARFVASVDRLLPARARDALRRVGEIATERGERAHVVGGFVRDMLLERENLDIDVVIEGDGIAFAEAAGAALGTHVKTHRRFGTAILVFDKNFHIDVTSSRTEYYARPGALPIVEPSSLRQDLFRRDFTINAMAACLDPGCFGSIADPFGGLRDLADGTVRVLHAMSFVDDPTRLLRGARFEERYRFAMDATTEALARQAVGMHLLDEVSGARLREELLDILMEPAPAEVVERLIGLGAGRDLAPEGVEPNRVVVDLIATETAVCELTALGAEAPDRTTALVVAFASGGSIAACERWLNHYRIGRLTAEPARVMALKGPGIMRALRDRRGMRDSRLYRLLEPIPVDGIAVLWARGDELVRERIVRYFTVLAPIQPAIDGRDLIALGAEPGEAFSAILARARDDRLDDRVVGREAELENLRRHAARAGLLPGKKDKE
jgi:tRNA nucleotidyltransferase (CCA-adding enzyme)